MSRPVASAPNPGAIARPGDDPDRLLAELWYDADGDGHDALARVEAALAVAASDRTGASDPADQARLRTIVGHLLIRMVEPRRAEAELRTAAGVLEEVGDDVWLARCLGRLALVELTTGATHEGFRHGERAVALALQHDLPGVAMTALANVGAALVHMSDPLGAIERLAEALNLADRADRQADVAHVLGNLAEAFIAIGDLPAAERYAELAVKTADQDTSTAARVIGRVVLASAHQARGDHAAAVATAEEADALGVRTGYAILRPQTMLVRMGSLRALGRPAEAVAVAAEMAFEPGSRALLSQRSILRERLLAHLDLGDDDAVRRDAALVLADAEPYSPTRAAAHEALAEVARRAGDHAEEAEQLRRALAVTRAAHTEEGKRRNLAIRSRAEVARAEYDAAEHRRRTVQLQRALDTLERDRDDLLAAESDRSTLIAQLERLADEDPLTGLPNRRRMERALADAPHYLPAASSFALIDVDHFKHVNDRYGHIVGDRVLARLARLLTRGTRPTDLVARVGGEEFAVLLADDVARTAQALERVRGVIAAETWDDLAPGLHVTVSIGLVPLHLGESLTAVLERADVPLYEAKRNGRDQVAVSA